MLTSRELGVCRFDRSGQPAVTLILGCQSLTRETPAPNMELAGDELDRTVVNWMERCHPLCARRDLDEGRAAPCER
jgi:hypothetical protein